LPPHAALAFSTAPMSGIAIAASKQKQWSSSHSRAASCGNAFLISCNALLIWINHSKDALVDAKVVGQEGQKKAPNALKSLDAELKSAPFSRLAASRGGEWVAGGGGKFSWLQGLEKSRNRAGISLRADVTQSRRSVWVVMARNEATKQPRAASSGP
jgi:hypothetical protein